MQKIETHIQDKVHSGYTAPCGWLFRGLTFFFPSSSQANGDAASDSDSSSSTMEDIRLTIARNTAQFGGAGTVSSLKAPGVTHVLVNTEKVSSAEISSLRKSLAAGSRKKIPHIVSLGWVEESWKHGTLLDEESKSSCLLYYIYSSLRNSTCVMPLTAI
jgi:DNA ligase-4